MPILLYLAPDLYPTRGVGVQAVSTNLQFPVTLGLLNKYFT